MKTFRIEFDGNREKSLTVECPDGKYYHFQSSFNAISIFEAFCDDPVFSYVAPLVIIKSVIAEVSHTPLMEVELENGDILKFSWVDDHEARVYVQSGKYNISNPESQNRTRRFDLNDPIDVTINNPIPIILNEYAQISTGLNLGKLSFPKYKVRRVQAIPETRSDEPMPYRQLGL